MHIFCTRPLYSVGARACATWSRAYVQFAQEIRATTLTISGTAVHSVHRKLTHCHRRLACVASMSEVLHKLIECMYTIRVIKHTRFSSAHPLRISLNNSAFRFRAPSATIQSCKNKQKQQQSERNDTTMSVWVSVAVYVLSVAHQRHGSIHCPLRHRRPFPKVLSKVMYAAIGMVERWKQSDRPRGRDGRKRAVTNHCILRAVLCCLCCV